MSRYIDADAIQFYKPSYYGLESFMSIEDDDNLDIVSKEDIKDECPTADVVEVVRCKDCKHHEELLNNNDGNVLCWVHDLDVVVDGNGYCNYGEREEQEHE